MSKDNILYLHNLRLPPVLSEDPYYLDMYHAVLDALVTIPVDSDSTNNIINIYCGGSGGRTDYATQLINAITYAQDNNKADVVLIVNGPCISNHAMVALAGERIEIQKYGVYFLFHKGSGGFSNDDPVTKVMSFQKFILDLEYAKEKELGLYNIFTKKETIEYDKGEDIIIKGEEMRKRLKKIGKEVW